MRKLLAAAVLSLAVVGSTFAPVNGPALAQSDVVIDQPIVDETWLTNQSHTLDNTQSNDSNEPTQAENVSAPADPPGCGCTVIPGEVEAY
ncbi:MAG: hypothetical protein AB7P40_02610 [Chloroflexota bacterium]